jgi:hypothetical protein
MAAFDGVRSLMCDQDFSFLFVAQSRIIVPERKKNADAGSERTKLADAGSEQRYRATRQRANNEGLDAVHGTRNMHVRSLYKSARQAGYV